MAPTLSIIVYRNEIIIIIGTIERKVIIPNRIAQNVQKSLRFLLLNLNFKI